MVLSKRERYIVIGTIIAVAALALDRYLLSPVLNRESQLEAQKQGLVRELDRAQSLFKRKKAAAAKWKEMVAGGLKQDASETENALQHAISQWSQDANLALSSVQPERAAQTGRSPEVAIRVVGTGPMSAVARFLWRAQTCPQPVKVVDMQVSSRREGTDDLSVTLHLSALYLPADWKMLPAARVPRLPAGGQAPSAGGTRP